MSAALSFPLAPPAGTPTSSPQRQQAVARWLLMLGVGLAVGLLAAAAAMLLDARQEVWRQAERSSANLAQSLARDIARNFEIYDLSLIGAIEALQKPGILKAEPTVRQAAIFDRAVSAKYMGSFIVLDAAGDIAFDSTSITPHQLHLADRDYFQVHRDGDRGLFVSQPYRSRMRADDPSIAISRRVPGPSGEFGGAVVGALRLAYFDDVFRTLDLGNDGVVAVVDDGGHIVARYPPFDGDFSRSFAGVSIIDAVRLGGSGFVQGLSVNDGVERMFAYNRVGTLPLHVSVGTAVHEIMAPWWRKAAVIGGVVVVLAGVAVAMCLLFRREMGRRLQAEASLREAAHRLEQAANTDALTGLANRRALQGALERMWRTAARNGTGLALLMIDADAFKKFNDRYGHLEGDRVLHLVGETIRGNLRRAGDLGARYGGEEFSVLLPDTELGGAFLLAERIRAEIRSAAIPHADGAGGLVSVSIGVAACFPVNGQASSTLVRSADQALYAAKHAGRNRVYTADSLHLTAVASEPAE